MLTLNHKGVNFLLNKSSCIDEICSPLRDWGITFFSFLRVYKDGSRIDIVNQAGPAEQYYSAGNFNHSALESNPFDFETQVTLWEEFSHDESLKICRDVFNVANGIMFVNKSENYCDLTHFATTRDNRGILGFYFNHLDNLKLFSLYFKDKAQKLIKEFDRNKVVVYAGDNYSKSFDITEKAPPADFKKFFAKNISRLYIDNNNPETYVTYREAECLFWSGQGKSAEEISIILDMSKRTAEQHLLNARKKLDCMKNTQIITKFVEHGLHNENIFNAKE